MKTEEISKYCESEKCFCGKQAYKKISEVIFDDDKFPNRHELTCYVCEDHFNTMMGISTPSDSEPTQDKVLEEQAKDYFNICLGGNMNIGTLKPKVFIEIMVEFYKQQLEKLLENTPELPEFEITTTEQYKDGFADGMEYYFNHITMKEKIRQILENRAYCHNSECWEFSNEHLNSAVNDIVYHITTKLENTCKSMSESEVPTNVIKGIKEAIEIINK